MEYGYDTENCGMYPQTMEMYPQPIEMFQQEEPVITTIDETVPDVEPPELDLDIKFPKMKFKKPPVVQQPRAVRRNVSSISGTGIIVFFVSLGVFLLIYFLLINKDDD